MDTETSRDSTNLRATVSKLVVLAVFTVPVVAVILNIQPLTAHFAEYIAIYAGITGVVAVSTSFCFSLGAPALVCLDALNADRQPTRGEGYITMACFAVLGLMMGGGVMLLMDHSIIVEGMVGLISASFHTAVFVWVFSCTEAWMDKDAKLAHHGKIIVLSCCVVANIAIIQLSCGS